jgi:Flp pilus assembly protein TadB
VLSDWERHELRGIEERLRADGGLPAASARRGASPRWRLRSLGFACLIIGWLLAMSGLVLASGASSLPAALLASTGVAWWVWRARGAGRGSRPADR